MPSRGDPKGPDPGKRVAAAGVLAHRLDNALKIVATAPRWAFWALVLLVVAATFPRGDDATSVFGLKSSNVAAAWALALLVVVIVATVAMAAFFFVRAMVVFLEEGRLPKRAGGVEVEDYDEALGQVERGARELSGSADRLRDLEKRLEKSQELIHYLAAELQRARGEVDGERKEREAGENR